MTKYRIITPHSDENPELNPDDSGGPLATYTTEGSAVDDLYKEKQDDTSKFFHKVKPTENVVYEDIFIPDAD